MCEAMALCLTAWKHPLLTGQGTPPLLRGLLSLLPTHSQPWRPLVPASLPVGQHQKDSRRGLTDFSCSAPSSPGEGWALTGQRSGMKALPAWRARACGLLGLGRRYGGGCGGAVGGMLSAVSRHVHSIAFHRVTQLKASYILFFAQVEDLFGTLNENQAPSP